MTAMLQAVVFSRATAEDVPRNLAIIIAAIGYYLRAAGTVDGLACFLLINFI
jgi:hypothetical protein